MGDEPNGVDETMPDGRAATSDEYVMAPDVVEIDRVYTALAHPRRRYLCYTLHEDTEWTLTELATKIAAWENDVPVHAVTDDQRDDVYVSLYHAHVPKLVDVGVLTFDEERGLIETADHAEQVLAALDGIGANVDCRQETHAQEQHDE